jgi:probable HAF family extracellular repeat protein
VAGNSDSSDGTTHAVLWVLGHIVDLGTLGGSFAQASAINELNIPVGFATTAGDLETHAWVGKLHDIGTLGGSFAQANAINEDGVVVGSSNTTGDLDVHAFFWTLAKGMVDLNSLLPAGSPWDLQSANGIAGDGTIVGVGTINGESHAFSWRVPGLGDD